MNLAELKQKLINNNLDSLYIFFGEEIGIMDKYIESIKKKSNKHIIRIESLKELLLKLNMKSLLNSENIYILKEDKNLLKNEELINKLQDLILKSSGAHIVILVYSKLDKRGKFYRKTKDFSIEFEKLNTNQLINYVLKELGLRREYSEELIEYCDNNYNRLMFEIDKLKCLAKAYKIKNEEAFLEGMKSGLISKSPKSLIFNFIDAVLKRDMELSFKLFQDLKNLKTSEMLILSLLYTNFRNVLLIQGSEKPTQEFTGLTNSQIYMIKEKVGYYYIEELIKILGIIQKVESGIKTGKIDSEIAIEYSLLKIIREEDKNGDN